MGKARYCEKAECIFCDISPDCWEYHNWSAHNMPLNWMGDSYRRVKAHLHYHIGWIADNLLGTIKHLEAKK